MSADSTQLGTIKSEIPARLDRLPWSRWHWTILIGLGTVWILDGLEVTIVGSIGSRLSEDGSGIDISTYEVAVGGTTYVIGACLGALFFGWLADRIGRKKLFIITLIVYLLATVATAFAMSPIYFWIARFFTGAGIGGEYAAINSAIDELIPARLRGRVDLIINGSFWVGAAGGALLAVVVLDKSLFAADLGWRLAFAFGAVLGVAILIVRRLVPESPRWLMIHGRNDEAEAIVADIERRVREDVGEELPEPDDSITVKQRKAFPLREMVGAVFATYPRRTVVGLSLFIGQAFIYNAVFFTFALSLSEFYDVTSSAAPWFIATFAIGNFLGPLLLGPFFDTVGRKPMIAGTYILSGALLILVAYLTSQEVLSDVGVTAALCVVFFFASAGASSAYLTVSEVFPMETRALAISFFYAVGTGIGGAIGPLLFGKLIESGQSALAWGYVLGGALMIVGGLVQAFLGIEVAQQNLEKIAKPLSATDDDGGGTGSPTPAPA